MKIGFIGAGNMGGAILRGAIASHFLSPDQVMVYDVQHKIADDFHTELGTHSAASAQELAEACEWIVLAVKPIFMQNVFDAILPALNTQKIISIAAGWSMKMLLDAVQNTGVRVLRVMPNTPALVGAGLTALCEETTLEAEDLKWASELFQTLGSVEMVPERLFDAIIAVSGSSPAYVFMFIEAMADAAVKLGLPRKQAIHMAACAVRGSAQMVLDTDIHPAVLKDQVCSPGGTTIEAVLTLEAKGFRSAVMDAMVACADKSSAITKGGRK